MSLLRRFLAAVRFPGRREKLEHDMAEEMRFHLAERADENVADGMSADEARDAAQRKFGNVGLIQERARDERSWVWLEQLLQDIRFAARALRRAPGFTAAVVLTLAVGIGANATIFSLVNAVLLKPLPYADPGGLVTLKETRLLAGSSGERVPIPVSPATLFDWRHQASSFEKIAAVDPCDFTYAGGAEPEQVPGAIITADLLPMLGVTPLHGRNFSAEEDRPGANTVALISHSFWQRRFASDPAVIGRGLTLDGMKFTIIGVLPPWFDGATVAAIARGTRPEIYIPHALVEAGAPRGVPMLDVHARLRPGATIAKARVELDAIMQRLAQAFPETNATRGAQVEFMQEASVGSARSTLWLLFAAVVLVLLIACANIANLLLARATLRRGETAVRAALGAGRARLIRQFLAESFLLTFAGCALGLLAAGLSLGAARALLPTSLAQPDVVSLDWRVVLATVIISLATGIVFGLAPAWHAAKTDLNLALKTVGRSGQGAPGGKGRSTLVVVQVALSLGLLVGAALLIESFVALSRVDPGFDPHNVLTLRLNLPGRKYGTPAQQTAFFEQLIREIETAPGVDAAAAVFPLPFVARGILNRPFTIPGQPPSQGNPPLAQYNIVTEDYFRTLGIRLTRGRGFTPRDRAGAPLVVIINETMAHHLWPGENPLGKRLTVGLMTAEAREVVGVIADIKQRSLDSDPQLQVFVSAWQQPTRAMHLAVRSRTTATSLLATVRAQLQRLDPEQPISDVNLMSERVDSSVAPRRFAMTLLTSFAATALALAILGLYSMMSYAVAQRTREFGVRMALGAKLSDMLRLIVGQGVKLVLFGLVLGTGVSLALGRLLNGLLFGVQPTDLLTFAAAAMLLAVVGAAACYFPARRAAKIDPIIALRSE